MAPKLDGEGHPPSPEARRVVQWMPTRHSPLNASSSNSPDALKQSAQVRQRRLHITSHNAFILHLLYGEE